LTADKVFGFAGPSDNVVVDYHATGGDLGLYLIGNDSALYGDKFRLNSPEAAVFIAAGAGDDQINVQALSRPATIDGGAGNDTVTAGYLHNKLDFLAAPLTFAGGDGTDLLNINETATTTGQAYTVGATSVSRPGAGAVGFDDSVEQVNLAAGNFSDQVTV